MTFKRRHLDHQRRDSPPSQPRPAPSYAPPRKGFYFDPETNRYYKIPQPGTIEYKEYQEFLRREVFSIIKSI